MLNVPWVLASCFQHLENCMSSFFWVISHKNHVRGIICSGQQHNHLFFFPQCAQWIINAHFWHKTAQILTHARMNCWRCEHSNATLRPSPIEAWCDCFCIGKTQFHFHRLPIGIFEIVFGCSNSWCHLLSGRCRPHLKWPSFVNCHFWRQFEQMHKLRLTELFLSIIECALVFNCSSCGREQLDIWTSINTQKDNWFHGKHGSKAWGDWLLITVIPWK